MSHFGTFDTIIMVSVIMLSVIVLSVVMLNVVAPFFSMGLAKVKKRGMLAHAERHLAALTFVLTLFVLLD